MASYSLTDEQEDDFKYAVGKSFKDWLNENWDSWKTSAASNRRKKLMDQIPSLPDTTIKQLADDVFKNKP